MNKEQRGFGLIGFPLSHSGSPEIFREIFAGENSQTSNYYSLFPLKTISEFPLLLDSHPELSGLNVTIPYKQTIFPFLDEIDEKAREIGAVNTIKIVRRKGLRWLKGYNTDADGFLLSFDFTGIKRALILGTGGSSLAVAYVLKCLKIPTEVVSRNPVKNKTVGYEDLDSFTFDQNTLIVNTTPLGMYPDVGSFPKIPYPKLTPECQLYDLVYQPEQTMFLKMGLERGAIIQNGSKMLRIQAERSFDIWNRD